jgi:dTDP-4-dehydrorhamnose 3,5-epimerase
MKLSVDMRRDTHSVSAEWRHAESKPIDGVVAREMKNVITNNGVLTELLRGEWLGEAKTVDQVFLRTIDAGGISAWHVHKTTTDRLVCITGRALFVLFDAREASPTHGTLAEYRVGAQRPTLLIVPPGVVHGVKALGREPVALINMVDEAYAYDEPDHWRLPYGGDEIGYRFPPD